MVGTSKEVGELRRALGPGGDVARRKVKLLREVRGLWRWGHGLSRKVELLLHDPMQTRRWSLSLVTH